MTWYETGYDGYLVNRKGEIWSNHRGKKLKVFFIGDREDQPRIRIKKKSVSVNQMVLNAFVGPRPEGAVAHPKNGDPTDSRLANLEWAQKSDILGVKPKLGPAEVKEVDRLYAKGWTMQEVADHVGVSAPTVSRIVNRKTRYSRKIDSGSR